ncbi:MAG: sarcosine oxidase subunit alpha family protein, partial [Rhodobacteraceae bacterium]|nr:sarcosine oxidase subunit alpha family protein [Paracoccaceae bacterium]
AVAGLAPAAWVAAAVADLARLPNVTLRARTTVVALHDHGYLLAEERPEGEGEGGGPRRRLWRVRAGLTVVAGGAFERPLPFAGNDLPGVMLAGAVRDYLVNWAVVPGRRVAVVTGCDDAYRTAILLARAGIAVPVVADIRPGGGGALAAEARALGIRVADGACLARVAGGRAVRGALLAPVAGEGTRGEWIACDAVAMSGGWSPSVHLWSQPGGGLLWDAGEDHFRPDPARPPRGADGRPMAVAVGAAAGAPDLAAALADADRALRAALALPPGAPPAAAAAERVPPRGVAMLPLAAGPRLRARAFLDFQNDVKVADLELAAREGYTSVEHAKRYTTLGMATDQGKLANVAGIAVLAAARGVAMAEVGTTTFRPPFVPVTIGALAGEARGELFQPVRMTPLHDWHAARGALWEPVGLWRRPWAYPRPGETAAAAVAREVGTVRERAGLLDASTLGKILVAGPDAGRFLDMLYVGMMSTLAVGRCRYGVMCNEQGFVTDDGVVARLGPETFLCHTTTGGADRIHGWMEEWLQTEWWDWKVRTLNLTEQFAQIAVAGPRARTLLERLGGMDVTRAALPFMTWAEGRLAGIPARVFRISFSGELSFEIAVAAGEGPGLWERLLAAGEDLGVAPYGTEAMHVLRAEKGYVIVGDETDGTVTPRDLGLGRMIPARKADFLGKRGMERAHLVLPDRWRLVGLRAEGGAVLPEGAYAALEGRNANGQRLTEGRVTSSYFSPTLGRGIALGLVRAGPERMGERLSFPTIGGRVLAAEIVAPCFWDPEGERLDG